MSQVWIEAALNGPWGRERQAGIPVTVEEIVADGLAAADAGAAIIHVHAYDSATGRQNDRWETYARIIKGIRAKADVIVYPTIPLAGSDYAGQNAQRRFAHTAELASRGLLEWTVCDPGSCNFLRFEEVADPSAGFVYQNPLGDIREGLRLSKEYGLHPGYAIYEPGFTRLGAALAAGISGLPAAIYRFMFSDEFAWGFPPEAGHLDAHLNLLRGVAPDAPWMVAGLGVDIRPLIAPAVARGGHVRVGLEDAPWGTGWSNRQWVEEAARLIRAAGGEPATAAQVRAGLAGQA
ncbi:BKACE family enzyme [Rhodopila globiformis]|uniref:3-keto-5-aminohexanoate cleavage protein n=1 Tax=Rhodopila globiformis TaxID=1071 RepID=A0A2S6N638_RHOGL|nr:3-keto-5-aminohexanoate cleavage protein [Rhodopila globiformis]PPQ30080.1 3-keto-5-aminohexanoate cleavage protein [Rhodopila globiformis]